jgi:hypothetical protein
LPEEKNNSSNDNNDTDNNDVFNNELKKEIKNEDIREEIEGKQQNKTQLNFVEILYGTVISPKETFARIAKHPPLFYSILTVVLIYLFSWLLSLSELQNANVDLARQMTGEFGQEIPFELLGNMFAVLGVIGLIIILLIWFTTSGTVNLLSVLFSGHGNAKGIFVCYGFSFIPMLFSEALRTLAALFRLPDLFNLLITLATLIWVIYLQTTAIKIKTQ